MVRIGIGRVLSCLFVWCGLRVGAAGGRFVGLWGGVPRVTIGDRVGAVRGVPRVGGVFRGGGPVALVVVETGTRGGGVSLRGGGVSLGGLVVDLTGKVCLGRRVGAFPLGGRVNLGGRVLRERVFFGSRFPVVRMGIVVLLRLSSRFGVVFAVRRGVVWVLLIICRRAEQSTFPYGFCVLQYRVPTNFMLYCAAQAMKFLITKK